MGSESATLSTGMGTTRGSGRVRHVLSALVQNQPGVLAHVSGMFASRGFNIESLAVGETATDTFTYTVDDGNGGTDTATVTITTEANPVRRRGRRASGSSRILNSTSSKRSTTPDRTPQPRGETSSA